MVPLEPEFIVPQDGHEKQDCESRASALAGAPWPAPRPAEALYLGDDLFSRQPICEAVRAADGHFLFVCKPSSHQTIEEYLTGVELPTLTHKSSAGASASTTATAGSRDVPLRGDADALTVNWLMIEIVNAAGTVTYRNSFITDLEVGPDTVAGLAACGRARWKIEKKASMS